MTKVFRTRAVFGLMVMIGLSGCHRASYSVANRQEGRAVKVVEAAVPSGASEADMTQWGAEIEAKERVEGKRFFVNFYDGELQMSHLVATYEAGRLATLAPDNRPPDAMRGN